MTTNLVSATSKVLLDLAFKVARANAAVTFLPNRASRNRTTIKQGAETTCHPINDKRLSDQVQDRATAI